MQRKYHIFQFIKIDKLRKQKKAKRAKKSKKSKEKQKSFLFLREYNMKITWIHIIEIISTMWDINQTKIANCLGVNPSTITKLKTGKQLSFSKSYKVIYTTLFDPENPDSPAKNDDPNILLQELKDIIKQKDLDFPEEDFSETDYKEFVIKLLRLAKRNEPHQCNSRPTVPNKTFDSSKSILDSTKPKPELMSEEFIQNYTNYGIQNFLNCSPANYLPQYLIEDAWSFLAHINYIHTNQILQDKKESIYQDIINFVNIMWEYFGLLKETSCDPKDFPENFTPKNVGSNEFKNQTDKYRLKLKSLYDEINKKNIKKKASKENLALHENILNNYESDLFSQKLIN